MSPDPAQPRCSICGEPIWNAGRAWAECGAWVDADGNEVPGTRERTGRLAHGPCLAREELERPPQDTQD